jgi:heat shock protein HslJ
VGGRAQITDYEDGMRAAVLAVVGLFMLAGCASQPGSSSKPLLVDGKSAERLHGIQWELKTLTVDGTRVIMHPDAPMALAFAAGGQVAGYGPVNQFRGSYAFSEDGRLTWPAPGLNSTRRAGAPELMEKERAFFVGVPKTTRAILAGNALQLQSDDGNTVLAFVRAGS